jgi:hypothetical protein
MNNAANANTATLDASGHTIHTPNTNCPNCHAFNIGGRCNCTTTKYGPKKTISNLDALNAIELVF